MGIPFFLTIADWFKHVSEWVNSSYWDSIGKFSRGILEKGFSFLNKKHERQMTFLILEDTYIWRCLARCKYMCKCCTYNVTIWESGLRESWATLAIFREPFLYTLSQCELGFSITCSQGILIQYSHCIVHYKYL